MCIPVAVFAEVSYDPPLEHIIRQKVSQHVKDTCSLETEKGFIQLGNGMPAFLDFVYLYFNSDIICLETIE